MNAYDPIATKIIQEQELLMGPVAWQVAGKVTGLRIDILKHEVNIEGDSKDVLEQLVAEYEKLFGRAAREVCRDAVRPLLAKFPPDQLPTSLR